MIKLTLLFINLLGKTIIMIYKSKKNKEVFLKKVSSYLKHNKT